MFKNKEWPFTYDGDAIHDQDEEHDIADLISVRNSLYNRIAALEAENAALTKRLDAVGDCEYVLAETRAQLSELREAAAWYFECKEFYEYSKENLCQNWKFSAMGIVPHYFKEVECEFIQAETALRALVKG